MSAPVDLDAMSDEEFAAYLAALDEEQKATTPEQIWRAAYREEMRQRRFVGFQPDLFGAAPVTHYRSHRPAAPFERPPIESLEAKLARIEGDPLATFGPPRADRPAFLTREEKARIVAGAANWLQIGQRVQIVDGPGTIDPDYGPYRMIGREGVVWRLCSSVFTDHCRVFLDPVGAERTEKIVFVELRDLEPRASASVMPSLGIGEVVPTQDPMVRRRQF